MKPQDRELYDALMKHFAEYEGGVEAPQVLYDCGDEKMQELYENDRHVFNKRFEFRPKFIINCASKDPKSDDISKQVAAVVTFINGINATRRAKNELPLLKLTVRSGGHDHEGESSATDSIHINFHQAKVIEVIADSNGQNAPLLKIRPGIRFIDLLPHLDEHEPKLAIPHGTCATVGVPGFTLGGGWGPWTRTRGMCCESLEAADVVLGDGTIVHVTAKDEDPNRDLLWALRGGGGLSYGIVTALYIRSFVQPQFTGKFTLNWNWNNLKKIRTLDILKAWENAITGNVNPRLLGTNLKVVAHQTRHGETPDNAVHKCSMYGYFAGTAEQAVKEITEWFKDCPWDAQFETDPAKQILWQDQPGTEHFNDWDRLTPTTVLFKESDSMPMAIPPELDGPAPHKITSRLTDTDWGDEGRLSLIESLSSDLLDSDAEIEGVHTYITLGAITGPYYANYSPPDSLGVAFPYRNRGFTIQYQVWWYVEGIRGSEDAELYVNRAMDWHETCSRRPFVQTNGSFISFKDSSIPTRNYFLHNYQRLMSIKRKYSRDPHNLFASRKTII